MALIQCPDCGKDVSDEAPSCIHCGKPNPGTVPPPAPPETPQQKLQRELEAAEGKPSGPKSGCAWVLLPLVGIVLLLGLCSLGGPGTIAPTKSVPPRQELKDGLAGLLNLQGKLCAEVIDINKLAVSGRRYEVRCIEYRGGTGTVDYIVDMDSGVASKR